LQQNLEKFLEWRKKKIVFSKTVSFQQIQLTNKNNHVINLLTTPNKSIQGNILETNSNKLYKPIQSTFLKKIFRKDSLNSTFFPSTKPFMQFWIFPLLGASFLTFLIFDKSQKTINYNEKFKTIESLIVNQEKKSKFIKYYSNSNDLFNKLLNKSRLSQNETNNSRNLGFLLAQYPNQNLNEKESNFKLSTQLENLCLFYVNLTNEFLATPDKQILKDFSTNQNFIEKSLLKPFYINNSHVTWFWYPLEMKVNPSKFIETKKFLQKLQTPMLLSSVNNTFFDERISENPQISYIQSSNLFDNWMKTREWNEVKNFSKISSLNNRNWDNHFLADTSQLNQMHKLETLNLNLLKTETKLIFHFNNLLKIVNQNRKNLKKLYTTLNIKSKDGINKKMKQESEKIQPIHFLNKFKTNYKYYFLKTSLKNYFKKNQLKSQYYTDSSKFLKLLKKEASIKNFILDKKTKTTLLPLNFNKILKHTFFLKHNQDNRKINTNTILLLKDLQAFQNLNLNKLNFQESFKPLKNKNEFNFSSTVEPLSLTKLENKLKKTTYEVLLLDKWKNLFSMVCKDNLNSSNQQSLQRKNIKQIEERPSQFLFQFDLNQTDRGIVSKTQSLITEINLYRKLSKISKRLGQFNWIKNDRTNEKIHNKILKYKNPILLTEIEKANSELEIFSKKEFIKTIPTNLSWIEMNPKQTDLKSSLSLVSKSNLSNTLTFLNQSKKIEGSANLSIRFIFKNLREKFPFSKLKIYSKFELDSTGNQLRNVNIKKFNVVKNFKISNSKKIFWLSSSNISNSKIYFKSTNKKKQISLNSIIEKRKGEKIFRMYASIKQLQTKKLLPLKLNFNNKNQTFNSFDNQKLELENFLRLLRKLKKRIKIKELSPQIFSGKFSNFIKKTEFKENNNLKTTTLKMNTPKKIQFSNYFVSNLRELKSKKLNQSDFSQAQLCQSFLKKLGSVKFLKYADFTTNELEKKHLEKKKGLEKKRRLKKLKLENRRRKKRKRFYPRPNYLRFQLYSSFLKKRYLPLLSNKFSQISSKRNFSNKVESTASNSQKILKNKTKINILNFKNKIYRQKKQNWVGLAQNSLRLEKSALQKFSLTFTIPTYHQQEFYKISNETLTEFERLCWKSYWLRSNLKPYIFKIQKNLKVMKELENLKESKRTILNILTNFLQPIYYPLPKTQQVKDFSLSQNSKQIVPLYFNIRESANPSFIKNTEFQFFKNLENKSEYDRFLYERLTMEIKNVKSQLNVDGNSHARSYKVGRKKIEKPVEKNFWDFLSSFQNQYLEPKIHSSSVLNFTNHFLAKPFGDLPTLRVFWALQKTNLFSSKENNLSKTLWETYKYREQMKNNKTRKFMSKFLKFYYFNSDTINKISKLKINVINKKINIFGSRLLEKNYSFYLRDLKFQLKNHFISKMYLLNKEQKDEIAKDAFKKKQLLKNSFKIKTFQNNVWFENSLENKIQKQMIHFWWSTNQKNPVETHFPIFFSLPVTLSNLNDYILENSNVIIAQQNILEKKFLSSSLTASFPFGDNFLNFNMTTILVNSSFWVCCCLLHVSILFTLIRIPEIRSLIKFQFLLLSKLTNIYLIGLFSIYDLIKEYKTKIYSIIKKVLILSNSDVSHSTNSRIFLEGKPSNINLKFLNQKTKLNYSDKFTLFKVSRQSENLLEKNLYKNVVHISPRALQKVNLRNFKNLKKILIQNNLSFQFNFRECFSMLKIESPEFALVNKDKTQQIKNVLVSSIPKFTNTFSGKNTKLFFIHKLFNTELNGEFKNQNWFYSWYTEFLWYTFSKPVNSKIFLKYKKKYLETLLKNSKQTLFTTQKQDLKKILIKVTDENSKSLKTHLNLLSTKDFSVFLYSTIQTQSFLSLTILNTLKTFIFIFSLSFQLCYRLILKLIDVLEWILLIFYKFLEKPAELMVAWIADIFLLEWSAHFTSYVPEAFDTTSWTSLTKFSRSIRLFTGIPGSFLIQRFFFRSTETFYGWILKSDADLMNRQKKGMIFWDIWTEILIQAAEKYQMNLSSLSTIKEEQEMLIENLLEEKQENRILNLNKTSLTEKPFLNSLDFKTSLSKMTPLTKYLEISPTYLREDSFSEFKISQLKNNPHKFIKLQNKISYPNFMKQYLTSEFTLLDSNSHNKSAERWAVNQYLTTQGRDTDLFMDIHPPKSFLHIGFLKTYLPAQEILGSLVCEISSGLFMNKVSKNVLIIGAPGTAKSFFIQALAGETELKIVTDNAQRYSFINGGVPVGMKLLREVFDSIALHTPCLFLLEDIHIIGERRPMLISDDEALKSKEVSFGADQEEIHEKNRLIYQLSRHSLSHYKRPYKGDFSMSIPTNHFSYDLFLGVPAPRKRSSDFTARSPLPMIPIEKSLIGSDSSNHSSENQAHKSKTTLLSSLQLSLEQFFAPPATSPFNILLMKEQKKLRPKKLVKEMSWSGLSYDQFMLISKNQYSTRVKVALLAELTMNNLSVKLDMITDLLVIIDSVRSNRGFVVFATTHAPALLDPALRRPGRFDETISLPILPSLLSRFEIFTTKLTSYTTTTDFLDLSLVTSKLKENENHLYSSISKSLLLLLNTKNSNYHNLSNNLLKPKIFPHFFNDYSIYSISQAFKTSNETNEVFIDSFQFQKKQTQNFKNNVKIWMDSKTETLTNLLTQKKTDFDIMFSGNDKLNYVSLMYSQAGQFMVEAFLLHDQITYTSKSMNDLTQAEELKTSEDFIFKTFYESKIEAKNTLLKLFAGKMSEFFILNNYQNLSNLNASENHFENSNFSKNISIKNNLEANNSKKSKNQLLKKQLKFKNHILLQTNSSESSRFENVHNYKNYWQSAIYFLDSLFQKRYLYNKNSIVSKMLFVEDKVNLRQPPSPPNSSIMMPAKKFENYKRTLKDFIQKPMLTINQKIQSHQKQRFLKLLYNVSIQESFSSISNPNQGFKLSNISQDTNFYNSFKELGYLDLMTLKPTSTSAVYKNRFLTRHRFSFLNQWWNGQLAEHNVETTYLSHVDWRSIFVQDIGDLIIDFPDADQYYNPRSRRWFLHSKSWSYWLDFEKNLQTEISQHFILQSFTKTSTLLNFNRELLDYLAFRFLRYHSLKELDLIYILIRFYKNHEC